MGDMGYSKDETRPIAVIGLSGRFPGEATNPEKLWEICAEGKDIWSPFPSNRFNSEAFYHPDGGRNGSVSRVRPVKRREIAYISSLILAVASF
jgi:acyl transferase domain-containing protein